MALPSNMTHDFSRVPRADIPRSSFDRSSTQKTTFDAGYLVPIYVDEALPGDTFNANLTAFARLATPLHPFMDNVYLNTFFFSVPLRLLWENFLRFMGEQDNPGDSTDFLIPQIVSPATTGFAVGEIYDHMELPTGVPGLTVSALFLRAYNKIWNAWFRDQNLQDRLVEHTGDGPDPETDYRLRRRGKRHDYFTSSLPWPQKGDSVDIPLGTQAPIRGLGFSDSGQTTVPSKQIRQTDSSHDMLSGSAIGNSWGLTSAPNMYVQTTGASGATQRPNIYADLNEAAAATINQLRQAFQVQKMYERDARGGTRYIEIVRSHFNVISPDARLQRPEYLGGGQSMVNLHTVPQTSDTQAAATPQGNLAAYGTASISGHGFTHSFTEHSIVIGLVSVRADINYQQGLNRMWSRRTKFDFYWPALAMIGEQAVLMKEIYATGVAAADDAAWGYQERFAEYRYKPSSITGEMRSTFAQSLDTWHLAQDFAAPPALDAAFIEDKPPIDRVIAVQTEPHFIMDTYMKLRCARPMPLYGIPGMIDHL